MIQDITITAVAEPDREEVTAYVLDCRRTLFPMLNHVVMPQDLQLFSDTYIDTVQGAFLQARTATGKLIGVVAMMPYDDRFPYLNFRGKSAVEVARLFVDPAYRKIGLGRSLVAELKKVACKQGIDMMYLHTHPFLEGAYAFWQKQGFGTLLSCEESGFDTLHMAWEVSKASAQYIGRFVTDRTEHRFSF